jgi:hypothetical protein
MIIPPGGYDILLLKVEVQEGNSSHLGGKDSRQRCDERLHVHPPPIITIHY